MNFWSDEIQMYFCSDEILQLYEEVDKDIDEAAEIKSLLGDYKLKSLEQKCLSWLPTYQEELKRIKLREEDPSYKFVFPVNQERMQASTKKINDTCVWNINKIESLLRKIRGHLQVTL